MCIGRQCNDFLIFRAAYGHLTAGRILYVAYPREHADLFKYSPTFALLFAPFGRAPFALALLAWNLLNRRPARWADPEVRRAFLASVLVFSVIFNHKAEQPSFVIALTGMATWYATSPRTPVRSVLTGATFIASVPIFMAVAAPGLLTAGVAAPLLAASACCSAAWFTMQGELLDLFPERDVRTGGEFITATDEPAV